jgi:hypothetical protein
VNGSRASGLALEARQCHPLRQGRLQPHVEVGQPRGVGEEERVRLAALTAARRRSTAGESLAPAGRPEVVRRRAAFAVRAGAADESLRGEPGAAVAEGADRRVVGDVSELGLGDDAVAGEQREDTQVEVRQRRDLRVRGREAPSPVRLASAQDRAPPDRRPTAVVSVWGLAREKRCLASAEAIAGSEGGAVRALWRENEG